MPVNPIRFPPFAPYFKPSSRGKEEDGSFDFLQIVDTPIRNSTGGMVWDNNTPMVWDNNTSMVWN